jgi:hypothetical protein
VYSYGLLKMITRDNHKSIRDQCVINNFDWAMYEKSGIASAWPLEPKNVDIRNHLSINMCLGSPRTSVVLRKGDSEGKIMRLLQR